MAEDRPRDPPPLTPPQRRTGRSQRAFAAETFQAAGLPAPPGTRSSPRLTFDERLRRSVRSLIRALRAQPGINVRSPSQHYAPYRSQEWAFQARIGLAGAVGAATEVIVPVTFSGPVAVIAAPAAAENFPEGMIGEVIAAEVHCYYVDTTVVVDVAGAGRWSLRKNGVVIPGFQGRAVSSTSNMSGAIGIARDQSLRLPARTPIHLRPGDQLELTLRNEVLAVAPTLFFMTDLSGWIYPARSTDDSIMGTMAD
jgi:hypothetical protein